MASQSLITPTIHLPTTEDIELLTSSEIPTTQVTKLIVITDNDETNFKHNLN